MLSKAHLTSHSRMSGSRWVIKASQLSGSWRSFLYTSSVYSCQLFLISSASFSALYWVHLCMKCSLGTSNFLEEFFHLSHSIVFLCLRWSLRKVFFSLLAILWNSAFRCLYLSLSPLLFTSLLFTVFVRPSQTAILLFCISFPWGWSWFLSPVPCHEPPSIVHQALYQM